MNKKITSFNLPHHVINALDLRLKNINDEIKSKYAFCSNLSKSHLVTNILEKELEKEIIDIKKKEAR